MSLLVSKAVRDCESRSFQIGNSRMQPAPPKNNTYSGMLGGALESVGSVAGALGSVAQSTLAAQWAPAKPESSLCTLGCAEILKVSNALQG